MKIAILVLLVAANGGIVTIPFPDMKECEIARRAIYQRITFHDPDGRERLWPGAFGFCIEKTAFNAQ